MCPTKSALISPFGSSLGQRVNASRAASEKISLASKPSCFPNFDMPALIILTSGFPFKPEVPSAISIDLCQATIKTIQPNSKESLQMNVVWLGIHTKNEFKFRFIQDGLKFFKLKS